MAVSLTFNGTAYSIPSNRQAKGWGASLSSFLVEVGNNALSKAGGSFVLTADTNFGGTYGLVTKYLKSVSSNIAQSGVIRLARADEIVWRNQANGADLALGVNSSNILTFNSIPVFFLALGSANHVLKMNSGGTAYEFGLLGDDNLNTLSWSKISKTGSNLTDLATRSHTALSDIGSNSHATIDSHIASTSNPHSVTASQVGLGNVDNTSDATKNSAVATLTSKTIGDALTFTEVATPSIPSAGLVKLYPKSDGNFYKIDDTGVEVAVGSGAGGSGEKNYVTNPSAQSAITGWNNVGDLDVARTTTAAELPREYTTATGIKITADSNTQSTADYVYYDFTLDDVDLSKKLKIQWSQKTTGTYNAGDLAVVITTQADRTTALHTPVTTSIPASDGVFITSFDASTTATLSLVIRATGDMTTDGGIVISDVIVGPGVITQGAVVSEWTSYTPTGSWVSNATYTGRYRRVGDQLEGIVKVVCSGAPTSATLTINLPSGLTIDTSKLLTTTATVPMIGNAFVADSGTATYGAAVISNSTTSVVFQTIDDGTNAVRIDASINATNPITFGNNDYVEGRFSVPIAEWAGSGTVNLGAGASVEYASNSSSTDAADTSSFVYGPDGSSGILGTTALTAVRKKRIRFQTAIQSTDELVIEVRSSTGPWIAIESAVYETGIAPLFYQDGVVYGIGLSTTYVSSTDIDVVFGRYASNANEAYAAAGEAWTGLSGFKWRVKKVSSGQAVGFGAATGSASGLLPPVTSMGDALATQLGHKQYLHGTSYSGGAAPTITLSSGGGSLSSVERGLFIPYQTQDGTWRMRFTIALTLSSTSRTFIVLAINGITFKNVTNWYQAINSMAVLGSAYFAYGRADFNTNTISCVHASATTTTYHLSGDCELESKPTWAY